MIHPQLGQFLFNTPRQPLGRLATVLGEFQRQVAQLAEQRPLLRLQLGDPLLAVGDGRQLMSRPLTEGQDLLDRVAVLALEVADQLQPLLHLPLTGGVELDAVPNLTQGPRQILHLVGELLGHLARVPQPGIQLLQAGQALTHFPQQIQGRLLGLVAFVEGLVGRIGQGDQPLGVDEECPLLVQLPLLAGLQFGRLDLVHLVLQEVHAPGQLPLVA